MASNTTGNGNTINHVADDVGADYGAASRSSRTAKETASDVMVEVRDEVSALGGKAASGAKSAATSGKGLAADAVHGLADAARQMASKLDDGNAESGNAKAAEYARKAADGMDRFSSTLRDKDVDQLADDVRIAVRQNPAIAVGAAALIGFALARFLKGGRGA